MRDRAHEPAPLELEEELNQASNFADMFATFISRGLDFESTEPPPLTKHGFTLIYFAVHEICDRIDRAKAAFYAEAEKEAANV